MAPSAPVLIAGGGIAGLTTALCLAKHNIASRVFERSSVFHEVGAGLQLSPNASRILIDLELKAPLADVAVTPEAIRVRSGNSGRELVQMPIGTGFTSTYGAPYWVVHRADLQSILLNAVTKSPLIDLQSGCAVARASRIDGGVRIEAQSEAGRMDETGSALIGADGVWSTLRTRTMKLPAAVYSGRTAWRATVPIEAADADDARLTGLWLGRNAHIVHYPVSSGKRLNIVVIIKDQWREETWNAPGDRALLEERLSDWCPQVKKMIAAADTWLKWALCGNDPSLPWNRGPMTLIGDAAHAMLPFLAQGAAMAIEDAFVLAQCLAGDRDDPARAIGYFADARKARVQKVVATARRNGHIYHLSGPMALARDTVMRALGGDRIMAGYDWLYGWQPVEKRPNRPNT